MFGAYKVSELRYVELVPLTPQKFARPLCWYYWCQHIRKYKFGFASSGVMFIPRSTKIRQLNRNLLGGQAQA
jgi:hypothetical protein